MTAPLPQEPEAELAALGAVLLDPVQWPEVSVAMAEEDLYTERNRELYRAIQQLDGDGIEPDLVAVAGELRRMHSKLTPVDVRDVAEACPVAGNGPYYARQVARAASARRLLLQLSDAIQTAAAGGDPQELAANIADDLLNVAAERTMDMEPIGRLVDNALNVLEARASGADTTSIIPSGFHGLDRIIGGLFRGAFYIVAARPGVGKTAFAANLARNVAGQGVPVAFFSLEMSSFEISMRMLASESGTPFDAARSNQASALEWGAMVQAASTLQEPPLFVNDSVPMRVPDVRAIARRIPGLGLVVVDYLQLMTGTRARANRQEEVAEVSRGLKVLAKELHVPVVACAQVNREPDKRSDKRPQLSELRESGSMEQDADVVILLYRETGTKIDTAEAIVAKQRNGPTGRADLQYQREVTRFRDAV